MYITKKQLPGIKVLYEPVLQLPEGEWWVKISGTHTGTGATGAQADHRWAAGGHLTAEEGDEWDREWKGAWERQHRSEQGTELWWHAADLTSLHLQDDIIEDKVNIKVIWC